MDLYQANSFFAWMDALVAAVRLKNGVTSASWKQVTVDGAVAPDAGLLRVECEEVTMAWKVVNGPIRTLFLGDGQCVADAIGAVNAHEAKVSTAETLVTRQITGQVSESFRVKALPSVSNVSAQIDARRECWIAAVELASQRLEAWRRKVGPMRRWGEALKSRGVRRVVSHRTQRGDEDVFEYKIQIGAEFPVTVRLCEENAWQVVGVNPRLGDDTWLAIAELMHQTRRQGQEKEEKKGL